MSTTMLKSVDVAKPPRLLPVLIVRLVLGLVGASLALSAFGLWIVPGVEPIPELSLIKLAASLIMLIGGLSCLVFARTA